jgi:cell division protein FtsB
MADETVQEVKEKGIQFFGEFEKHPKGGYRSEYPAWMHQQLLTDMKDELKSKQKALDMRIQNANEAELREQVKEMKARIDDIESSRPKLTAKAKDDLMRVSEELEVGIRGTLFTRDEMKLGLADAHRELERSMKKCIPIRPDLASAAGIKLEKGKGSREDAIKVWRLSRRACDPDLHTNPEYLRA